MKVNIDASYLLSVIRPGNLLSHFHYIFTISFFIFFTYSSSVNAQTPSPFAWEVDIVHACGDAKGSLEYVLNGDPNEYTFYWDHIHAPVLKLRNLEPGTYRLTVINKEGCIQIFESEILEIDRCEPQVNVFPEGFCYGIILINLRTSSGGFIPASSLDIEWIGGTDTAVFPNGIILTPSNNPFTITRYVSRREASTVCVRIRPKNSVDDLCCSFYECWDFKADPNCNFFAKGPIVVNEFNNESNNEFVELLVVGDGSCGGTTDIRGFHLDDNNGYLIPPNEWISEHTYDIMGIDAGFLSFSYHKSWENVPNGSLIVLYSNQENIKDIITDPNDDNKDGVYILGVDNEAYLHGKIGKWDYFNQETTYEGQITAPSWDLVNISNKADGVQVRYPDGTFCHGISFGTNEYAAENQFPLWITDQKLNPCNCRNIDIDFLEKSHFECVSSSSETTSPGAGNNEINASIIDYLRNCAERSNQREIIEGTVNVETGKKTKIVAYPNPFKNEIHIDYFSDLSGECNVEIFTVNGEKIYQDTWQTERGINNYFLQPDQQLPSGLLLLIFTYPDGIKEEIKITKIR